MKQKPVYSLVEGDIFIAQDNQEWTVDEVIRPDSWSCLPHW